MMMFLELQWYSGVENNGIKSALEEGFGSDQHQRFAIDHSA
jgi:hypothetical protein